MAPNNQQSLFVLTSSIVISASAGLGDGDLALLLLLSLGDDDAQDAVLHGRTHCVLVDPLGETERSGEFSYASFRDPKLGFGLLGRHLSWCCLGDLATRSLWHVFNGSLVFLAAAGGSLAALKGSLGDGSFDQSRRGSARAIRSLGLAADG